jgi:ornithine cyclodeaminase/alanine dehydrogenase-like protein (mu-crystallin family)
MPTVTVINGPLVARILSEFPSIVEESLIEALHLHAAGTLVQPPKVPLRNPAGTDPSNVLLSMPARVSGTRRNFSGIKWLGSNPKNRTNGLARSHSLILLNDGRTNAPIAVLDGTEISLQRTAAVCHFIIKHFVASPQHLLFVGFGSLAKLILTLENGKLLQQAEEVFCVTRTAKQMANFTFPHVKFVPSIAEVSLSRVDLCIVATTAKTAYLGNGNMGGIPAVIGLSLRDFDATIFQNRDTIIVDDLKLTRVSSKLFDSYLSSTASAPELVELSSVLRHDEHSVIKDVGRFLAIPRGMAIEDLCLANAILRTALKKFRKDIMEFEIGSTVN